MSPNLHGQGKVQRTELEHRIQDMNESIDKMDQVLKDRESGQLGGEETARQLRALIFEARGEEDPERDPHAKLLKDAQEAGAVSNAAPKLVI